MKTKLLAARPAKLPKVKVADDVAAFMEALQHPLKTDLEAARRIILSADARIGESIKWNAPSFRTTEFFATTNLRALDRVQFIFHLGAKVRKDLPALKLDDPAGLVKWLAKDRCLVTLGAGKDVVANQGAFADIVREWIKYL